MSFKDWGILAPAKAIRRAALLSWANFHSWSTEGKYIVIESDDWGGIRTASPEAYQAMLKAGDNLDRFPFTRYDALASEDDLELLFDLLSGFTDMNGNHPVFTANCSMANPDFNKIRESGFSTYFYEPFTETFKKYQQHSNCFALWQQAMSHGLFFPQLHGREHLNVSRWLRDLHQEDKDLRLAFDHQMISGGKSFGPDNQFAYLDAFNYGPGNDRLIDGIVSEGAQLFHSLMGYQSRSFVPACYVWNHSLEKALARHGIEYIQSSVQLVPTERGYGQFDEITHRAGERNQFQQVYLVRNCIFEPSLGYGSNAVDFCMAQIRNAFLWKTPATICSHRVNYVGYIDQSNRDRNLPLLKLLLTRILECWPEVQFITSVDLGSMIAASGQSE